MITFTRRLLLVFFCLITASAALRANGDEEPGRRLTLASGTTIDNSGLLDVLIHVFFQHTGVAVDVLSVGTGKAVRLGEHGVVDLLFVHAENIEERFVEEGFGVNRQEVMYNDFIIIGPSEDPAGIRNLKNVDAAFFNIRETESLFISRGDESGTHIREKEFWYEAGIEPSGSWYREVGQGMAVSLTMADDMQGYILTDRGTYISLQDSLDLELMVEGDLRLYNPYRIIAVNPNIHPHVNYEEAMQLIAYLTSITGQKTISDFTRNGQQLFYPAAVDSPWLN